MATTRSGTMLIHTDSVNGSDTMMTVVLRLLLFLLPIVTWQLDARWNACSDGGWVPYREDGSPNTTESYYACIQQSSAVPDWESAHSDCQSHNATLAWWTGWKELAFFYHAFQQFEQTLSSDPHFMVTLNLRDKPYPSRESYYRRYTLSSVAENQTWSSDRQTMIPVNHRRYPQSSDQKEADINCALLQMQSSGFTDSSIKFVPCEQSGYTRLAALDTVYQVRHFICRKERQACPPVTDLTLGSNVETIDGIFTHYYGTIRNRVRRPNPGLLANVTDCLVGCDTRPSVTVSYFSGDTLRYWCKTGYRTEPTQHSWQANYAQCSEEGRWQYRPCESSLCTGVECQNGGVPYLSKEGCICDCTGGWLGPTCKVRNHYWKCEQTLCHNGGTCIPDRDDPKGYKCQCVGAVGDNCEYELNECSSNPCADGSLCVDELHGYNCVCDLLSQGRHCTEVVPLCERISEPCKNGASCYSCNIEVFAGWCAEENKTQYLCECRQGFVGQDCSVEIQLRSNAGEIVSVVFGCMLFVIVSLLCEIIGSKRRHDHENLQVLLDSVDHYLKQQRNIKRIRNRRPSKNVEAPTTADSAPQPPPAAPTDKTHQTRQLQHYGISSQSKLNGRSRHSISSQSKTGISRSHSMRHRLRESHSRTSTSSSVSTKSGVKEDEINLEI